MWAFGSRATGKAKDTSDLDLAVIGEAPLDSKTFVALRDAFSESNIPYKVDVENWAITSGKFFFLTPITTWKQQGLRKNRRSEQDCSS